MKRRSSSCSTKMLASKLSVVLNIARSSGSGHADQAMWIRLLLLLVCSSWQPLSVRMGVPRG